MHAWEQVQVTTQDAFTTRYVNWRCELHPVSARQVWCHVRACYMAHGQKVGFCSVMVVTMAALNLAACEVNEGRQVNPLGNEKWKPLSVSPSTHSREWHWEIRCTDVCDVVFNGSRFISVGSSSFFSPKRAQDNNRLSMTKTLFQSKFSLAVQTVPAR